jgi:heme/copper-type cytochrome/quinol oxidase subunit 2
MRSRLITAIVSASLAMTATAASAQSAQALSLTHGPAAAQARESDLGGRRSLTPIIIGLGVIGLLVFVLIEVGKDHPIPTSP